MRRAPARFFYLKEFSPVSNSAIRILKITTGGPKKNDYQEVDVCFNGTMDKSNWGCKDEKKMRFLNVKAKEGEWPRENNFFELSVKEEDTITSFENPQVISGLVSLVYCYGTKRDSTDQRKGKCKDISKSWFYGVVWTDNYEFAFAIQKSGASRFIFGDKANQTIDLLQSTDQLKVAITNGKLYKAMNLNGAGKWTDWANKVNSNTRDYSAMQVGFRFSKDEDEGTDHKCNGKAITNFLDSCDWSLIDVSRYTGMNV